jgi:hypothetical protein
VEVEHLDRKRAGKIDMDKLISLQTRLLEVGILMITQFSRKISIQWLSAIKVEKDVPILPDSASILPCRFAIVPGSIMPKQFCPPTLII